jgi:hypothetical protein
LTDAPDWRRNRRSTFGIKLGSAISTVEANMRTLFAIALFAAGSMTLSLPADAARKTKRIAKSPHYTTQQYYRLRERLACEERARHEDPTGRYAAFPCWAREAFGRGTHGGGPGRR